MLLMAALEERDESVIGVLHRLLGRVFQPGGCSISNRCDNCAA